MSVPTGLAWIGSPASQRPTSAANSPAVAYLRRFSFSIALHAIVSRSRGAFEFSVLAGGGSLPVILWKTSIIVPPRKGTDPATASKSITPSAQTSDCASTS